MRERERPGQTFGSVRDKYGSQEKSRVSLGIASMDLKVTGHLNPKP